MHRLDLFSVSVYISCAVDERKKKQQQLKDDPTRKRKKVFVNEWKCESVMLFYILFYFSLNSHKSRLYTVGRKAADQIDTIPMNMQKSIKECL